MLSSSLNFSLGDSRAEKGRAGLAVNQGAMFTFLHMEHVNPCVNLWLRGPCFCFPSKCLDIDGLSSFPEQVHSCFGKMELVAAQCPESAFAWSTLGNLNLKAGFLCDHFQNI